MRDEGSKGSFEGIFQKLMHGEMQFLQVDIFFMGMRWKILCTSYTNELLRSTELVLALPYGYRWQTINFLARLSHPILKSGNRLAREFSLFPWHLRRPFPEFGCSAIAGRRKVPALEPVKI